MLKPRPLPPAHKNQLFVPVKSIGFFSYEQTPTFFRNHEIIKKRLKHKPTGVLAPPPSHTTHIEEDESLDKDLTSSQNSMTSPIHTRGRASLVAKWTSFLTEDPTSCRSYDGRSQAFSPVLECSKYNIIGEPRFRKKRAKRSEWTLPRLAGDKLQGSVQTGHARYPKTNFIDLRSIYGSSSKLHQVPAEARREDTIILPPLEIGRRQQEAEASVDAHSLAEKRLVMNSHRHQNLYRRVVRDPVTFPTACKPYFRFRPRQHNKFVRSLIAPDDVWEKNRKPVHCSRCDHRSTASLHYCDVLGKRFCRFCSEMTNRAFSQAYEGNRLLVPSPNKSSTLLKMKEPSFIGITKVVITKTTKEKGQRRNLEPHVGQVDLGK